MIGNAPHRIAQQPLARIKGKTVHCLHICILNNFNVLVGCIHFISNVLPCMRPFSFTSFFEAEKKIKQINKALTCKMQHSFELEISRKKSLKVYTIVNRGEEGKFTYMYVIYILWYFIWRLFVVKM